MFVGILLITGCRDNASSNKKVNNGKSVNDVLEKQTKAEEQKEQTEEKDKKKESTDTSENTGTEDVDYDLTEMNSDMVYATVYQMMMEPEQYEGKTIRIDGNYYISKDEATGNTYHFCVIKDALACCAQGLEFVRKNEEELSDEDYPEQETEIIVQGTFETYKEPNDETLYCRITDADMQIKK
nr:hypothetical protein [Coprococcus comes]